MVERPEPDDSDETVPRIAGSARPLAAGDVFDGRFVLERLIGKGASSTVWQTRLAEPESASVEESSPGSPRLTGPLAIKLVPAAGATRVLREGAIMRVLGDHPKRSPASQHFIREHEHGVSRQFAYVLMDLVTGTDLHRLLQAHGRLPSPTVIELSRQLAEGLGEAHAMGFVHRDLKPSNLFLADEGTSEVPRTWKLLDFGIAKDTHDNRKVTASDALLGSPAYMAPEQIQNARDVDARADLWSVAVVLYQALTGLRPFTGTGGALLGGILAVQHQPPKFLNSELPETLTPFFNRALAKRPELRFPTMFQFHEALVAAFNR